MIRPPGSYEETEDDVRLRLLLEATLEKIGKPDSAYFHTKVAGVKFENADGSSRLKIIKSCTALEVLDLVHEPDNPYDSNAVAVKRSTGQQLGYLDRRTAEEAIRRAKRGTSALPIFWKALEHDGKVVGAVVAIVLMEAAAQPAS